MARIIAVLVVFGLAATAEGAWLHFVLPARPYYDRHGNLLADIAGRRNRPGVDAFSGGGKIYPDVPGKVLARYERDGELLVQVDLSDEDAAAWIDKVPAKRVSLSTQVVRQYGAKEFQARLLSEAEAKAALSLIRSAESGVTK